MHDDRTEHHDTDHARIRQAHAPSNASTGQTVQAVEPDGDERPNHMHPVEDAAQERLLQIEETGYPYQKHPGDQHGEGYAEQDIPDRHGAPIAPLPCRHHVEDAEDDKGHE